MVTSALPSEEARRLRKEFERQLVWMGQDIPDIMGLDAPQAVTERRPSVKDVPLGMVESTLNRVWGDGRELRVKEFDELWRPDKPEVALIRTTAGDRVLKTEKPDTGQPGILNEGASQLFLAELNLRSTRMGVDGLRRRNL